MATIKDLTTALLEKVADCDEKDLAVFTKFNQDLQEKLKARNGCFELITKFVPSYKREFCWDGDTALITDVHLDRQYFSDWGECEYYGSTHGKFHFEYRYKGVLVEIVYKTQRYNRYVDLRDSTEGGLYYEGELDKQFGISLDGDCVFGCDYGSFDLYNEKGEGVEIADVQDDDPRRLAFYILKEYCEDMDSLCY